MITVLSLILQKYICIYIHTYFFGELRVNLLVFCFSHWQNVCVYLSFCCVFLLLSSAPPPICFSLPGCGSQFLGVRHQLQSDEHKSPVLLTVRHQFGVGSLVVSGSVSAGIVIGH